MVKGMKGNIWMTRNMELVNFNGRMEENMKENGLTENNMDVVK